MGSVGRKRKKDLIDHDAAVAERIRKIEVMHQTRVFVPKQWTPNRDALYAIAGHLTMLGCWDEGGRQGPGIAGLARPHYAAQYLWQVLDARGFTNPAEAQDWTVFLQRVGAIPEWIAMEQAGFGFDELTGPQVAEARPSMSGPSLRRGFTANNVGNHTPAAKALYYTGIPSQGLWHFHNAGTFPYDPSEIMGTNPDGDDIIWGDNSSVDYAILGPGGETESMRPGSLYGDFGPPGDPVAFANNTHGFSAEPCGGPIPPPYVGGLFPGAPMGPFGSGVLPCPNDPPGGSAFYGGTIWRYKMVLPGDDIYLLVPPRQQDPGLFSSEVNFANFPATDPGLDWLADAAEFALPDHPFVSAFYGSYLPIALAQHYQTGRYRWQSLDVVHWWKGFVDAKRERDRVILKGSLYWDGHTDEIATQPVFYWPENWQQPGTGTGGVSAHFIAYDENGTQVPMSLAVVSGTIMHFSILTSWAESVGYVGPHTLTFDGVVIPTRLDLGTYP